ncbi:hypothetical protein NDU88_005731 [Pleurodeles waltl]|uniref:Uncharacterized protein n=1 Tax=Pleurodeles waltl TaxID=8319 RepID=A0AAV7LM91_PLEWA|nr:hypothetical protein NDU88_005731 [Pleurodeles waltl]
MQNGPRGGNKDTRSAWHDRAGRRTTPRPTTGRYAAALNTGGPGSTGGGASPSPERVPGGSPPTPPAHPCGPVHKDGPGQKTQAPFREVEVSGVRGSDPRRAHLPPSSVQRSMTS